MSRAAWLVVSHDVLGIMPPELRDYFERVMVDPDARPGYAYIIDPDTLVTTNLVTGKSSSYRESVDE